MHVVDRVGQVPRHEPPGDAVHIALPGDESLAVAEPEAEHAAYLRVQREPGELRVERQLLIALGIIRPDQHDALAAAAQRSSRRRVPQAGGEPDEVGLGDRFPGDQPRRRRGVLLGRGRQGRVGFPDGQREPFHDVRRRVPQRIGQVRVDVPWTLEHADAQQDRRSDVDHDGVDRGSLELQARRHGGGRLDLPDLSLAHRHHDRQPRGNLHRCPSDWSGELLDEHVKVAGDRTRPDHRAGQHGAQASVDRRLFRVSQDRERASRGAGRGRRVERRICDWIELYSGPHAQWPERCRVLAPCGQVVDGGAVDLLALDRPLLLLGRQALNVIAADGQRQHGRPGPQEMDALSTRINPRHA